LYWALAPFNDIEVDILSLLGTWRSEFDFGIFSDVEVDLTSLSIFILFDDVEVDILSL